MHIFKILIPLTNVIADDVMIHGESDDQHDMHLLQVLNKFREIELKLNPDKCQFGEKEVQFYHNIISSDGVNQIQQRLMSSSRCPLQNQSLN